MFIRNVFNTLLAAAILFQAGGSVSAHETKTSASEASNGMTWSHDLQESLDQAQKSNKLVLADMYTDWCSWCKRLDATTFADPKFTEYVNEHFVAVKLNAEDKAQGTEIAKANDVTGFPTGLVLAPNGKVVGRVFGYLNAKKYRSRLIQIAKSNSHSH